MLSLKSVVSHPLLFRGDHGAYSDMLITGDTGDQTPTHRFIFGVSPLMLEVLGEIPASKEPSLILPDFSLRTINHLLTFLRCGVVDTKGEENHLALLELLQHLDIDQQNKYNEVQDIGGGVGPEDGDGIESDLIKREKVENDDEDAEMKDAGDNVPPPVIRFSCQQCELHFSSSQFLNKHIKQKHKQGDLQCDQCPYITNHKGNFKHHVDTKHKKLLRFQCDLCNKMFDRTDRLESHKNAVHDKLKSFVCDLCGKSFAWKVQLALHVRMHTGEKPFCCGQCAASFASSKDLKHHEKITHHAKG